MLFANTVIINTILKRSVNNSYNMVQLQLKNNTEKLSLHVFMSEVLHKGKLQATQFLPAVIYGIYCSFNNITLNKDTSSSALMPAGP